MSLKNQFSNHFIVYLILFFFLNQVSNSQSKRSTKKDQKVIKVPNSDVFQITAPILISRGISRIVCSEVLIAL